MKLAPIGELWHLLLALMESNQSVIYDYDFLYHGCTVRTNHFRSRYNGFSIIALIRYIKDEWF